MQIVANHREGGRTVQRVLATLGRVDQLAATGTVDALLRSLGRFAAQVQVIQDDGHSQLEAGDIRPLGLDLAFGRLWQTVGLQSMLLDLLQGLRFEFPVERTVYLTVLDRLRESSAAPATQRWRRNRPIPGPHDLDRHHCYRAMRWLGETQAAVEQALFLSRRALYPETSLAFFDTTSLSFAGLAEDALGPADRSKYHQPPWRQLVVGTVLTGDGRPICCEFWPGNYVNSRALLQGVDGVRERFGIHQMCWVADREMINTRTLQKLEQRQLHYILGARLRREPGGREQANRSPKVADNLGLKEVWVRGRRYIVCHDPAEAAQEATDREAILRALQDQFGQEANDLLGHRSFQRLLRLSQGPGPTDHTKVALKGCYDGMFVLRTNTTLPAAEVAAQYKRLRLVKQFFGVAKSALELPRSSYGGTVPSPGICSARSWLWCWWMSYTGAWRHAAGSASGRISGEI